MSVAEQSSIQEFRENPSHSNGTNSDETAKNGGGTVIEDIEKYLSGLSRKKKEFVDPKLKKETQKLVDLLRSYKNLSEELDRKCAEAAQEGLHVPTKEILNRRAEIYALLHPELYKNRRDEEKNKFIEKLSTRRHFNEVDKVIAPDLTPIHQIADKRQIEKERFCRLIASAPTRFHNCLEQTPGRFKQLTRPPATPPFVVDVRESEKERLARIFATSVTFSKRPTAKKNILRSSQTRRTFSTSPIPSRCQDSNFEANRNDGDSKLIENFGLEPTTDVDAMVRIGEYSPLNRHSNPAQGRTVLGVGEHEEKKKMLAEERYNEYRNFQHKARREKVDEAVMVSPSEVPRFLSTTSTQTEFASYPHEEPIKTVQSQKFVEISPREKLLFDLYGHRSASILEQEEKRKQLAYALALKEQIEEKKRLEEERRHREREEEEMIERRFREQLERIQKEHDCEPNEKEDLIAQQRESQDEHIRKRLALLNLEEEELLKREKLGRLSNESDRTFGSSYTNERSISAVTNGLQTHVNRGKAVENKVASVPTTAILPESLPEPGWDQDWSQMRLKGVDLLREHRTQKDRLQLPPLVDNASKVRRSASKSPSLSSPVNNYVPSTLEEAISRSKTSHHRAEAILKAPLDEPIVCKEQLPKSSSSARVLPQRPTSPVIPAVRTERIIRRNSRILEDKWKVPPSEKNELERTGVDRNNVLTQLGAFRRQLALEREKLEERIREMVPS